jgi:rare lipoprotein A
MKTLLLLVALTTNLSAGPASWYGAECHGKLMANGKPFDMNALTCASYNYPLGTTLLVTSGTKSVVVKVTDRGPNRRLKREIDLSRAAFKRLAPLDNGLIQVKLEVVK